MASIDRRLGRNGKISYRARTRLKGYPQQVASFTRKTDARQWAEAVEAAQREGRHFAPHEARRHTLTELIARYQRDVLPIKPKNARSQRRQLDWWCAEIGHLRLADVTPPRVVECRDRLLTTPNSAGKRRSPATVVRYLAVLSHAFSVAMKEWGWVDDNPLRRVSKPREPRGRVRFLDDAERGRLLAACMASKSPLLYPIVVLALSTGMRLGEIRGMRWPQVDFERGRITLLETKNGERRGVPLTGRAQELLRALHGARRTDTDCVFPSPKSTRPVLIAKAWSSAVVKAGLVDFRFHDLRHCAASYLVMNEATLAEVGEVLGHKSVQMSKRYAHLAAGHTQALVAAMNERIFTGDARC